MAELFLPTLHTFAMNNIFTGSCGMLRFNRAFLKGAAKPVSIAVERADGQVATTNTFIHSCSA